MYPAVVAIIDAAYLQAMLPADVYARVFDPNGTGTVGGDYVAAMIAAAESTASMILNGGGTITVPLTGTVDPALKVAIARIALYEATRMQASDSPAGVKSPYRQGYEDAVKLLEGVKTDRLRLVTANDGARAYPRASGTPTTNRDGNEGGEYARTQDGRDTSGF